MSIQYYESERNNLLHLVEHAREEDLGGGDVTGRLLPAELRAHSKFVAREPMVVCGAAFLDDIAREYNDAIATTLLVEDGQSVMPGDVLAKWDGPAWAVVAAERVALNFLQRLSGVATITRRYVDAVAGTKAEVLDTRKTTPAWRELEKYAVRVGGGTNHRRGLYDAIMIKDNHIAFIAGEGEGNPIERLRQPLQEARKTLGPSGFVEIEVDTLDQFEIALTLPVDIIMLDNMAPELMAQAVERRNAVAPNIQLEASGGITLRTIRAAAESGVERISVGALTHSAPAMDIGLDSVLGA